mmetsp:Transcript_90/g.329  ORF Transcript_90/g.329 Transcript_90/m.329 type:complete len:247 (-) Transcript_90:631-1371(-)
MRRPSSTTASADTRSEEAARPVATTPTKPAAPCTAKASTTSSTPQRASACVHPRAATEPSAPMATAHGASTTPAAAAVAAMPASSPFDDARRSCRLSIASDSAVPATAPAAGPRIVFMIARPATADLPCAMPPAMEAASAIAPSHASSEPRAPYTREFHLRWPASWNRLMALPPAKRPRRGPAAMEATRAATPATMWMGAAPPKSIMCRPPVAAGSFSHPPLRRTQNAAVGSTTPTTTINRSTYAE